jgi:hypothetical protein
MPSLTFNSTRWGCSEVGARAELLGGLMDRPSLRSNRSRRANTARSAQLMRFAVREGPIVSNNSMNVLSSQEAIKCHLWVVSGTQTETGVLVRHLHGSEPVHTNHSPLTSTRAAT